MGISAAAVASYALIVFLIGFIFGTLRVLVLAPHFGETGAVSLETPVMLAASWFVCRACVDRLDVWRTVAARSVMGAVAFVVLMAAEISLALLVFGRSVTEHIASCASVPGAIGLAAQVIFATFPVVQVSGDRLYRCDCLRIQIAATVSLQAKDRCCFRP